MESSMGEETYGADGEILLDSGVWSRTSSILDITLEAQTGNSSNELENGNPDLTAEISDLNLRLQKQSEDNTSLKNRLTEAQEDYFNVLQNKRDELDRKSLELKGMSRGMKRLERELSEKNQHVSSLEERNGVLNDRIKRLENDWAASQKERKELYLEIDEMKTEVKKSQKLVTKKKEEICQMKAAAALAEDEGSEEVKRLTNQVDCLKEVVDQLSQKVEELQLEKLDIESQREQERGIDHCTSPPLSQLRELSHLSHLDLDSFDVMDVSSDDIETELLVAEGRFPPDEPEALALRFDVAIQCERVNEHVVLEQDAIDLYAVLTDISETLFSARHMTLASNGCGWIGNEDEFGKVDQIPNDSGGGNNCDLIAKGKKMKMNKEKQVNDAQKVFGIDGNKESDQDQLSGANASGLVKQINQRLAEFREQLKTSQGLMADSNPSDTLKISISSNQNNKSVKYDDTGTQTDSLVIETPIPAQNLTLSSGFTCSERVLIWPWNVEETIKIFKQSFSKVLMILGLFVFLRGFLLSLSVIDDDGCMSNPSFFGSNGEYFSYCGELSHDDLPVI